MDVLRAFLPSDAPHSTSPHVALDVLNALRRSDLRWRLVALQYSNGRFPSKMSFTRGEEVYHARAIARPNKKGYAAFMWVIENGRKATLGDPFDLHTSVSVPSYVTMDGTQSIAPLHVVWNACMSSAGWFHAWKRANESNQDMIQRLLGQGDVTAGKDVQHFEVSCLDAQTLARRILMSASGKTDTAIAA